ncbi:sulfatase [Meridianimarinicoccus roseus]|uniref:Sulfatase n=1 Tax=Meridianimarinicoccus roseus TaxID=2072018 RepID=A0A2V2LQK5_9RHOB|nr:sulfatase-like hydrolase/transferase [Meridianimarinicoccus roseus]PWR03783.1 sulfatase [Meridianimarinicoccus roseus]
MTATALRLLLAAAVLHVVLVLPSHPGLIAPGALAVLPLELPAILLALLALGKRHGTFWVRAALTGALLAVSVLKLADIGMIMALGRGFNPVTDIALIGAGLNVMTGAIGPALAAAAVLGALAALAAAAAALWWATGVWAAFNLAPDRARIAAGAAVLGACIVAADVAQDLGRFDAPATVPGTAFTARVGVERIAMARETFADLRAFAKAATRDPYAGRRGLLDRIDRDVMVIFVESYGRASLDTPLYAGTHRATLAAAEERLVDLGLATRSGFLSAPTRGGQSWLSHATFANGLWIDNQASYGAALASGRHTLFHIAADAGFRTAAVMPQITLDWPESAVMGFDVVLPAAELGYRGAPFNWVTMPDQFTLAALDRKLLGDPDARPLFAQVALGSSHAPWVPVPELVPWDVIGDGTVFNDMAAAGDPPEVVWRDRDRVREQYRLAVDYALRAVFDYVARQAGDAPLILVLGDHQAAGFVALDDRTDVPVHLIGPKHLVERAEDWGWSAGLLPDAATPPRPMNEMRDLILDTFSTPAARGSSS